MTAPASHALVTEPPVWLLTGCSTGFGREIASLAIERAALPGMRQRRRGVIVNFSSIGGLRSFPAVGYYNATRFAVEGLSDALRQEVEPLGIQVMVVEPSGFRGRLSRSQTRLPRMTRRPTPSPCMAASPRGAADRRIAHDTTRYFS